MEQKVSIFFSIYPIFLLLLWASINWTTDTQGWYVVCEYWPPGNDEGDNNQFFLDNVKPQTEGKDTDTVESGVTPSQSAPPQSTPTQNAACGNADLRWGAGMLVVAALVASNVV